MSMAQRLLDEAISKHQAGNLKEAKQLYRQALKQELSDSEDLRCALNLGEILVQQNKPRLAIDVYKTALRRHPESVDLLNAMGITQAQTGDLDQAEIFLERALSLTPGNAINAFNLAKIYKQQGNLGKAEYHYRQAIQWQPDLAIACNNLGNVLTEQGSYTEAEEYLKKAITLKPDYALAYNNLGQLFSLMDRHTEAIPAYQQAIRLKANYMESHHGLAKSFKFLGNYQAAAEVYKHALLQVNNKREQAAIYNDLGEPYMLSGQYTAAQEAFESAIRLNPGFTLAQSNLGVALFSQQRYQDAEILYKKILKQKPNTYYAYEAYGNVLRVQRRYDEALICYEKAIQLKDDFIPAYNNRLFMLSYHVLREPKELLQAHMEWCQRFSVSKNNRFKYNRQGDMNKKLRIGYLSPDFNMHPVNYFIEPILANHDHDKFQIFCYAEVAHPDEVTRHLQSLADQWCFTVGMSDTQLAHRIHDDQIDILIDLAGFTRNSRIRVCTYKPAPVQATYLGYFSTTGLDTMDYWISDSVLTPENTVEQTVETIFNLDRCCLGYTPPTESPEVSRSKPPDVVTFGCFNDLSKISDTAIELWSEILNAVPSSKLLLKAKQFHDPGLQKKVLEKFSSFGISPDRIELRSRTPSKKDHLALYGNIDIALDTIPRTGGATTMEALWMGVPVITLQGRRFIERLSSTMIHALDHDEWIASTKEEFITKAVLLAKDPEQRLELRRTLRQQVMASPLYNGKDLARSLEQAYRKMWQIYLSGERM